MELLHIHLDGTFTVLMTPTGEYQSLLRVKHDDTLRTGQAKTPRLAIWRALGDQPSPSTDETRHRDSADYDPHAALQECWDLWASGAWDDTNAAANLSEVMDHLEELLT